VTWSVIAGTGSATIGLTGLLTAVSDGTVTAKAVSVSTSSINGILVVTITNQPAKDKTALISAIANANLNKVTVTISVDGSDVTPDAKWVTSAALATYVAAIGAAQAVVDDANATQGNVNDAVTVLTAANAIFNAHKANGLKIVEKAALNAAISAANANKVSVVVSVDGSNVFNTDQWVTGAALAIYADAIVAAQLIADKTNAIQAEVDSAVTTLGTATNAFNLAKTNGTKVPPVGKMIDLGSAGDFVALAESGISTTGTTAITGNIGVSPVAASYLTGFDQAADPSNQFAISTYVTGKLYAADYAEPTPTYLTNSISWMETAFTTGMGFAAGSTELYAGDLSGKTIPGGVYKWGNDVHIDTDVTLNGSATETWIFQVSGKLTEAANMHVLLSGGALAKNIFWIVSDVVEVGAGASLKGTVLAQTNIVMDTGSSATGRLLAQTAISLDATTLVYPS